MRRGTGSPATLAPEAASPAPAAAGPDGALPSPRRADVLAALVLVTLVVLAFWEVAVGGRTLMTSIGRPGVSGNDLPPGYGPVDFADDVHVDAGASAWQFEPWAEVVHRELAAGQAPLWNPYQGAGTPLAANMQSAAFDPLLLPVRLHPSPRVWDLTLLASFVAGAIATYALGRLLGLGTAASATGGAAFVLSGFFMLYGNNHYVRAYFFLPALLVLVELLLRSRSLLPVAGLAVVVALILLAGMPEAAFFVLTTFGAFSFYRLFRGPRVVGRLAAVARFGSGGLVGVMLAAPALVPFAEYLSASLNLHDPTTGLQADPVRRAVLWVVPYLTGQPASGTGIRSWVGMAVPALGVVAVGVRPAMRRHHGWFFLGVAAVLLLKQFGAGVVQWIGQLPVADRAIFKLFSVPVTSFCLAMLAAIGVQVIEDRVVRRRHLALGALVLVLLVLAGLGMDARALTEARARAAGQLGIAAAGGLLVLVAAAGPPSRRTIAAAAAVVVAGGIVAGVALPAGPAGPYRLVVLVGAVIGLLALVVRPPGVNAARSAALVACLAVVAELLVLVPRGVYPRLWDPYVPPGWLDLVRREAKAVPDQGRVFGLGGILYPDTAGAFGLQDVRTLDALYVRRYAEYVRTFVEPEFDDRFTGRSDDERTPPNMHDNPMWDLLGVRWVLSSIRSGGPGGAYGGALPARLELVGSEGDVEVREDPARMPRAFMAGSARWVASQQEAVAYLSRAGARFPDGAVRVEGFDPASEVVVEGAPGAARGVTADPVPAGPAGQVRIVSYRADRVVLSVTAERPGIVVLTDVFFPGWKATVDGRPAAVLPADVAFRGVEVGAGQSTVVFSYEPESVRVGIGVAVLGLAMLAVIAGLGLRRRRRQPRTPQLRRTSR